MFHPRVGASNGLKTITQFIRFFDILYDAELGSKRGLAYS